MILQMKQLRLGWVSDLPKVTGAREAEQMKIQSQRASLLHLQLLPGFCVFPSWCSGGTTKAHPTVPLSLQMSLVSIFACFSPPDPTPLASLLQVARATECSISTRSGPPQPAPRGQRRPDLQKSVLLLLVKETQGVCFPLPWVTKSSQSAVTPAPMTMQDTHQHIKGLGHSEAKNK